MSDPDPALTIGLAVYNNASTVRRAIESLLAQTYRDFVLVVSDDCSRDKSAEIAREFARRDPRVRVVMQPVNRNYGNFRWLVEQASTRYFMFAAADDWWDPRFVEACIARLVQYPEAVLAVPRVQFDGIQGREPGAGTYALTDSPARNIARYLRGPLDNSRMYGVFLAATAKRAFPRGDHHAYDWTFSAASLREGTHLEIDEVLMRREATPPDRYMAYVARDNRRAIDRLLPLFPMTRALLFEMRIPINLSVLRALLRINLELHISVLNHQKLSIGRLTVPIAQRLLRYL